MTRAAERDIRSALRQLRGCRGRLAMARTGIRKRLEVKWLTSAQINVTHAEAELLALLSESHRVRTRKVNP